MLTDLFNFTLYDPTLSVSIALTLGDYIHDKSSGFGLPEIIRFSEQGPLQHGATDRGYLLKPRELTFKVKVRAASPAEFYAHRAQMIKVLKPSINNTPAQLRVTLPDSTIWKLNVYTSRPIVFTSETGLTQMAEFTLVAPDPAWMQVISPNYLTFLQAEVGTSQIMTYSGAWITQPYPFSVRGPLTHPVIQNLTGGYKIDLNYAIPDNQTVLIDLRYGYKTVQLGTTNLLPYLSSDSDLEGFYLLPDPDAANGNNTISLSGSGSGANTRLQLGWTPVRLGL